MRKEREVTPQTKFARRLRRRQTATEARVWQLVRRKQLFGLKFRRQHPVGGVVVDFYCPDFKLVLEIDGEIHSHPDQAAWDRYRDQVLSSLGLRVVRVPNAAATENNIRNLIADLISPLSAGEG